MSNEHNYTNCKPYRKYKSNSCCSVPQCSNRCTETISLHKFPDEHTELRKKWMHVLRMKLVPKCGMACSEHFTKNDFLISSASRTTPGKLRRLKRNAVPSVNLPQSSTFKPPSLAKQTEIREREKRYKRRHSLRNIENIEVLPDISEAVDMITLTVDEVDEREDEPVYRHDDEFRNTEIHDEEVQSVFIDCSPSPVTILDVITTDDGVLNSTGLPSMKHFNALCKAAEIVFVAMKVDPNRALLSVKGCILMTLMKLKLNVTCECLASFFRIDNSVCIDLLFSTIDVLYFILKPMIKWPSREQIDKTIPKHLPKFSKARVVLDYTEVPIMKLDCMYCRMRTYSHYKGTYTIKFMAGVSPSGMITFISNVYGGRASEKLIFEQSNLVKMCNVGDAILVNKGTQIEEECAPVTGSNVETTFQRIKNYKILKEQVHSMFVPHVDKIVHIVCGLVNISNPIFKDVFVH